MIYIDHRIVGDGSVQFALTALADIGKYIAQIVADPRTVNRHVLAYTEVLSMNEIWDVMAKASGEEPLKDYVRFNPLRSYKKKRSLLRAFLTDINRFR